MTQRNSNPQNLQAVPTGMPESLRVALGLALVLVLISLITVLNSAGFGVV